MNNLSSISPVYHMVTASMNGDDVVFPSNEAFLEAIKVGFFRIPVPQDVDVKIGEIFANSFTSDSKYTGFGELDVVNGLLKSDSNQTVRFTLERDNWDKCHINQKEEKGPSNYPAEIQKLGHQMHAIGIKVLRTILKRFEVPQELWFDATGGASEGEGSHFLLFNSYDPSNGSEKPFGVAPHKDWGHTTVLYATDEGLEAEIDGIWRSIQLEKGFFTINFGYPLEDVVPVNASNHRVLTRTLKKRISIAAFIDPRVGKFRDHLKREDEGMVYKFDSVKKVLENGQTTVSYYTKLSNDLYGANQSGNVVEEQ